MLEINKLAHKHRSFGVKLFLSYIILTLLLILTIITIHIYLSEDSSLDKFQREVSLQSSEKKTQFDEFFKSKKDALLAITNNEYFLENVKDGSYKYYIDLLLLTIMEANKDYMQIRFIDVKGHERLKFHRDENAKEPYKSNILQNKKNRYYFQESSVLKKGEVWFSPIDLNIEYGKVQKPYTPVLRIATPIYIKQKFNGILIINIFMQDLLNNITKSTLYDIYLIDEAGYYLKHKNKKYNWSIYTSKHSIDDDFLSQDVYKIQSNKQDILVLNKNTFLQTLHSNKQQIKMLMVEKDESIQAVNNNNNKMILTILIVALFISIIFTFLFTRTLKSIFEVVVKQSDKLHDLATNLDHKVKIQTLENAKKDRLLQNQSKLAELGDMIGNIAHQWRHPLTRLSLTLQNLKAFKKKNKMSDPMFDEAVENSLYQIEFMSNTIDNFKNFYKKDEEKSTFLIIDAVKSVLNIIGSVLEHSHIELEIIDEENLALYANKNEFSQVLMNLMINSKDAIDDNKINNPRINISIFKKEKNIYIEVKDNAGGVPEHILDKIFNPYFTTKKEKGTGIGLYLSKAIIEDKMKGKLYIKNIEDNAVFTIQL